MYAPTLTNSPRSGPTSGESGDGLTDFDGAGEILRAWGNGLRPPPPPTPDLNVSSWPTGTGNSPRGPRPSQGSTGPRARPTCARFMDRLSPGDPTQRIVFMKAAQVGATEAGNNWIGFVIHQAPGPMLAVQPTVETGQAQFAPADRPADRSRARSCGSASNRPGPATRATRCCPRSSRAAS